MITPATPASTDVFVVGDGTFTDHATVALVERCGFTGSITTAAALAGQNARAVIFRDEPQLARILAIPTPDDLVLIGLDTPPCPVARGGNGRRIVWIDGPLDHSDVQPLLRRAVGDPTINRTRVHTTPVSERYSVPTSSAPPYRRPPHAISSPPAQCEPITEGSASDTLTPAARPVTNPSCCSRWSPTAGWGYRLHQNRIARAQQWLTHEGQARVSQLCKTRVAI